MDEDMSEEQPMKFKQLTISAEEMDYLSQKFEIRDHRDLFSAGIKLLYDLAKAEEHNWYFTLTKGEFKFNNEILNFLFDENYRQAYFNLQILLPNNAFARIDVNLLDERLKVKKE
jgi:hypothetical protein